MIELVLMIFQFISYLVIVTCSLLGILKGIMVDELKGFIKDQTFTAR